MATKKTLISLSKRNGGGLHNITLNYDDATVEAITQAALDLLHMHRMAEGDNLSVSTIEINVEATPEYEYEDRLEKQANKIDGYDRDDLGESPDY